ncbi:MAG: PepSY domain-containing protein [Candidatus Eremiobacteraeota bacterium]|nr:PepSY domain-containing protein [Candidatus Eremiobacteraeota bacterium]
MNFKTSIATAALALVISAPAFAQTHYTGQELAKYAKVSLEQARATALRAVHGAIVAQELEKETGGLRYSFDIKVGKKTYEVGVDAKTGKVIENAVEGANPD